MLRDAVLPRLPRLIGPDMRGRGRPDMPPPDTAGAVMRHAERLRIIPAAGKRFLSAGPSGPERPGAGGRVA
jgi:hypothetical protein